MASSDLIARVWMLDLRQKSYSEIGGTAPPKDIWRCVRRRIETDEITCRGVPLALSANQVREVKDRARSLAEYRVAVDAHAII
jgi:hypothetical protein